MVNGGQKLNRLLTREEETALGRLKPLVMRHLDLILETLILFLGSDPKAVLLLTDAAAVDRLKQWQREYLLALFDGNRHQRAATGSAEERRYRDPLGLGPTWHLRMLAQVMSALLPLIQEAFESRPRLCRSIEHAMMNVVFHDIERLMATSLEQRDEWVQEAKNEEHEIKKTLDSVLSTHEAEEHRRLSRQLKVMEELMVGHLNLCGLTRRMSAPLNLILDSAEKILEYCHDSHVQLAVMSIVSQVEVMIQLREPLRALGQKFPGGMDSVDEIAGAGEASVGERRRDERAHMRTRSDDSLLT